MQMAGKEQISSAISQSRYGHLCSTHQTALVVTFRQIKWMVSYDHFNDFVCQRAKLFTQTTNLSFVDASTLKDQLPCRIHPYDRHFFILVSGLQIGRDVALVFC